MSFKLSFFVMGMCIFAFAKTDLILSSKCDDKAPCVEMDLNHGSAWSKSNLLVAGRQAADGNTTSSLMISAKLGAEEVKKQVVNFTYYTDGIECTDFGQGKVAVLSTAGGNPVLLTNKGPLEIVDKSLKVGCDDCARFVNTKTKHVTPVITRTSDMSQTEISSMSVRKSGALLYRQSGTCIEVPFQGRLKTVPSEQCAEAFSAQYPAVSSGVVSKKYPWLKLGKQEEVHEVKDTDLVFLLKLGACS